MMTMTPPHQRSTVHDSLATALTDAMADIHRRGWCDGTGGNFSCVIAREPLELLMAPSGVDKGQVQPQELITVDGTGSVLAGHGKASAETALHLAIVQACDAGAVLHTHSQAGTLLSQWALQRDPQTRASGEGRLELADLEMLKGLQGFTSHACVARVPVLANDQNLPRLASRALPLLADAPQGLLIAGHGLYAWGSDLATARRHLEILEFLLEQRWRQLLLEALLNPPQVPHQSGTQSTVTHTEATPPSSSPRP
jgi:methylthioribulose-1-phosphate dehydratase